MAPEQLASGEQAPGSPWSKSALARQGLLLLVLLLIAAPAATPLAELMRWGFPLAACALAGWLALRGRAALYLSFCLWLFLLTPLVRRIADAQAGYAADNVLMLAPYAASAWAVLHLPRFLLRPGGRAQWPLAVLLAAVLYGAVLALAYGRFAAGALDLLRWGAPPVLAAYVIANARYWDAVCEELRAFTLLALPLISLYGLAQFFAPPHWDVLWMLNSGMRSIGQPLPYEIRVFGPLNSPASFAYYLEALLLITATIKAPLRSLNITLGLAALAVTLVRSAWLGLALGLLLLALTGPMRAKLAVVGIALAVGALAPLTAVDARLHDAVAARMQTLGDLDADKSFRERARSYAAVASEVADRPEGTGLGSAGVASRLGDQKRVIDGGPLEIALALGVVGGWTYLAMVLILAAAAAARRRPAANRDIHSAAVAIALVQLAALASATTTIGEIGVLFWLSVGLALSAPSSGAAATEGWVVAGRPRGRLT